MVPVFDYLRDYEKHQNDFQDSIRRVIESGCLILGAEGRAFEEEFSKWVGVKHTVGCASGTDALVLALRAMAIGPGDEVITTANGPVPTVAAIRMVGAIPRFVDIDPNSLQMDPFHVSPAIGPKTRAILLVHLYGNPAPVEEIARIASTNNLILIEDCAQAHGAYVQGRHVGTTGSVGCFSFYPTKNLGAFGDGGACITNDTVVSNRIRSIAHYGFEKGTRIASMDGVNSRLDELQAAILRSRLPRLGSALLRREWIAETYSERLQGCRIQLPQPLAKSRSSRHLFVIRTAHRDAWSKKLASLGVQTALHYPNPVHNMPAYRDLGIQEGDLPFTEKACREVLTLPLFPELTDEEVALVIDSCIETDRAVNDSGSIAEFSPPPKEAKLS